MDKLISRPFLSLLAFVRRHPLLTLFILILLFVIDTVENVLASIAGRLSALGGLPGALGEALGSLWVWLGEDPRRRWWLSFLLSLFFPLAGWLLIAWGILDTFKPRTGNIISPEQG